MYIRLSLSLFSLLSGAVPAKTGLQWQQPFLQLVLACMNAQAATHEELLGPLKSQLQSFLAAFDRVCIYSGASYNGDSQSRTLLCINDTSFDPVLCF